MDRRRPHSIWRCVAIATAPVVLFLVLTLLRLPSGAVIGTGQDEWYNVIRALRALYEHLDPAYFIHPALYYELLAFIYALDRVALSITGRLGSGVQFLDYFLGHEAQFLDLARYVSVSCGALAVAAAAWLGTLLAGASGGLLAGLIIASLPLLQTMATSIRVDTIGLATMLVATALVVRRYQRPRMRSLLLAGGAIGIATAANYPGALLLALLAWIEWTREGDDRPAQRAAATLCACAVALAVFLALDPYVLIDLADFVRWFSFQAGVAFATHPHGEEPNPAHYWELLRAQGPPAVAACVAGVAAIGGVRKPTGAVGAFGSLYFAAFSVMRTQYDRFALPALALLSIAGVSWLCAQAAKHFGARAAAACVLVAAPLIAWSAAANVMHHMGEPLNPDGDYRREMLAWIVDNVPADATLVFESDTLPLLQTVYDPGTDDDDFHPALRRAFERLHPRLPKRIVKAQFIADVYNYDPKQLQEGQLFFLASSQNRAYITANRAGLAEPAAFYAALDARARVVYETGGVHERLILYAAGAP
jgi:hypothetical protein